MSPITRSSVSALLKSAANSSGSRCAGVGRVFHDVRVARVISSARWGRMNPISIVCCSHEKLFQLAVGVAPLERLEPLRVTQNLPTARDHATPFAFMLELDQARRSERPQAGIHVDHCLGSAQTVAAV